MDNPILIVEICMGKSMISLERFSLKSACFSVKHCYEVEIDFVMSSTIMRPSLELAMLFLYLHSHKIILFHGYFTEFP